MNDPTLGSSSTSTTLDIEWQALTSTANTGASTILSYYLEMDSGSGFAEVVGFTTPYTSTSYTVTSLTAGSSYSFRLSA